jgi:Domain of unknown function (DUF892)
MSSGSSRAESAVEPTRSQNITVSWRRSAAPVRGVDVRDQARGPYNCERKMPERSPSRGCGLGRRRGGGQICAPHDLQREPYFHFRRHYISDGGSQGGENTEGPVLAQLKDIHCAEKKSFRTLPKIAKAAEMPELTQAFLENIRKSKMARSPHANVRGNTIRFYEWPQSAW